MLYSMAEFRAQRDKERAIGKMLRKSNYRVCSFDQYSSRFKSYTRFVIVQVNICAVQYPINI